MLTLPLVSFLGSPFPGFTQSLDGMGGAELEVH